ncbi:MAG: caspase family protein [Saprospiraceae bacterium]
MPKTLHVLFVGINAYPSIPLKGCVNDVLDMYDFLRTLSEANQDIGDFKPKFLLAPDRADLANLKENNIDFSPAKRTDIVAGFDHFADAEEDDICVFYFSGHGSFQTAPLQFRHQKSAPQVETIVAVDSRMYGGRDLVDKELGYLIWKTVKDKPNLHFVAITDCCHSGDNTREVNNDIQAREANPQRMTPLKSYVGLEQILQKDATKIPAYYQVSEDLKHIDTQSGTHVHLAAARENETAKEKTINGKRRGVFTHFLLKTLRNGGLQATYEQLLEEVGVRVKATVSNQIPIGNAFGSASLTDNFFNQSLRSPRAEYLVYYDNNDDNWKIKAGRINGIPQGDVIKNEKGNLNKNINLITVYDVADQGKKLGQAGVGKVNLTEARVVDMIDNFTLEKDGRYRAVFTQLAFTKIPLQLASGEFTNDQVKAFTTALSKNKSLALVDKNKEANYVIRNLDNQFVLTKTTDEIPLFKRQDTVEQLLLCAEKVANWQRVLSLESPENQNGTLLIERSDIDIRVEIIEGKTVTAENIEGLKASRKLANPTEISTQYQLVGDKYQQPAFRLTVKTKNANYWVGGLYLSSKYGIFERIKPQEVKQQDQGAQFQFEVNGRIFKSLPLSFDPKYHQYHITEVVNYLKIFVSTEPFKLSNFKQEELPLDVDVEKMRSNAFDTPSLPAWRCITIPMRLHCPYDAAQIPQISFDGTATEHQLSDFNISCPKGFKATVKAASERQVKRIYENTKRSAEGADLNVLNRSLLPPATLFGNAATDENALERSAYANPADQLSILELEVEEDVISADNQLIIRPNATLKSDEAVLPFGYDEQMDLYIPLGYTNDDGEVCIEQLPPASEGQIFNRKSINERSIGRSIKLFFKKVILQKQDLQKLVLHKKVGADIEPHDVNKDELVDEKLVDILLVIHGIIGTTEGQVSAALDEDGFGASFDAVLSFDYENLNTPIEETAKILQAKLRDAGVFDNPKAKLTIVAHSMGGLVSRYFIEQMQGHEVVQQLIMCGTPNGGSETGDFRKSIFGMLTKALNGAAVLKPYLPVLTFLGKQVGKKIFYTHNQMTPGSEFLADLMNVPTVQLPTYYLIAGNTSLIKPDLHPDDPFWHRWGKILLQSAKNEAFAYFIFKDKSNDMAVRVTQMKRSNGLEEEQVSEIDCDHMSYFMHQPALTLLNQLLVKN